MRWLFRGKDVIVVILKTADEELVVFEHHLRGDDLRIPDEMMKDMGFIES